MTLDPRQFEVNSIMNISVPLEIRRNYELMVEQSKTFGVTKREHALWNAQYPMVGDNRSLIEGTDFKKPTWCPKHIKFKRPKRK